MTGSGAARIDDVIKHTSALLGFAVGAVAGAVVAALIVGTGGLAAVAICAVAALGAGALGAGAGALFDACVESPGVKTGVLELGEPTILIEGRNAVGVLDVALCYFPVVYNHGPKAVVEGSKTVYYGCRPATRQGDKLLCDAFVAKGSSTVLIGGPAVRIKGTRRTWLDTVLDYADVFLTVLSGILSPVTTLITLAITEPLSYGMYKLHMSTLQVGVATMGIGIAPAPLTLVANNLIDRRNSALLQNAMDAHMAAMDRIQADLYTSYLERQLKYHGNKINPNWIKHWKVQKAISVRAPTFVAPKTVTKFKPPTKLDWASGAASLGVGITKLWREIGKESNVPDRSQISCDDSSWLEPA